MRKVMPVKGERRIVKKFALIPTLVNDNGRKIKVWLESYYNVQTYIEPFTNEQGYWHWDDNILTKDEALIFLKSPHTWYYTYWAFKKMKDSELTLPKVNVVLKNTTTEPATKENAEAK